MNNDHQEGAMPLFHVEMHGVSREVYAVEAATAEEAVERVESRAETTPVTIEVSDHEFAGVTRA